jgi:peroxiredoxin
MLERPTARLLPVVSRAAEQAPMATVCRVRNDLVDGNSFPNLRLPEHTGKERSLSELAGGQPLVLCFVRGWWCPKEQVRLRILVSMQHEIQREYGEIVVATVDEPYVNGAFRAGLGADFAFLSDQDRRVARELDLLELSDAKHEPFLPYTFLLDSQLRIHRSWLGFWYWGNPTPDELRLGLRKVTQAEQPSFEPQVLWSSGGSGGPGAGIEAPVVWIREDGEGREIQRGAHEGSIPEVGTEVSRSTVDARAWIVHEVEERDGRVAIHLRKAGQTEPSRMVGHHVSAPPPTSPA